MNRIARRIAAALAALTLAFSLAASSRTDAAAPAKVQRQHVSPVKVQPADWWIKHSPIHDTP